MKHLRSAIRFLEVSQMLKYVAFPGLREKLPVSGAA